MSRPKSNSLFHFTKTAEVLKRILKNGLFPRYCLEDMSWYGLNEHVAYPMVSFCDIPLSRIHEHTNFYGEYGLGLTKSWGLKNQLDPVIYCDRNGLVNKAAEALGGISQNDISEGINERISMAFACFAKLTKPLTGGMYIGGDIIEKEFYQESEWRYLPREGISQIGIFQEDFDKEKEKLNKDMEKHGLTFSPTDIAYIFVQKDADIPDLIDFIYTNLGIYPLNDLKILYSRIVSLETLHKDI